MSVITDESTIFSFVQSVKYTAQNSGSQGSQDFSTAFTNLNTYVPVVNILDFNTTSLTNTLFNTYFKVQGYNPITKTYETWHCRGTPLLLPPSGHNLLNISVIATWTER